MSKLTTIYVARPATDRGAWRITDEGRLVSERMGREDAVAHAVDLARMREAAGDTVLVKLERADGAWVTYRGIEPTA